MHKRLIKFTLVLLCGVYEACSDRQGQRELLEYELQLDGINVENIYDIKDDESLKKMLGFGAVWLKATDSSITHGPTYGSFNISDLKNIYDKNTTKILGSTITKPFTFNSLDEIKDLATKLEKNEGFMEYAYLLFFDLNCKTIEEIKAKELSGAEPSTVQPCTILRFDSKGFFFSTKVFSSIFENSTLRPRKNKTNYTVTREIRDSSKVMQKLERKFRDSKQKLEEKLEASEKKHAELLEIIRKEAAEREAAAKLREDKLKELIKDTLEEAKRRDNMVRAEILRCEESVSKKSKEEIAQSVIEVREMLGKAIDQEKYEIL